MKQWKLSRDEWMAVYDNFKTKVSMWLSVSCDITLFWNGELKGLSIYEKEENREHRKSLETHEKCYKSLERVKKAWNSFEWEHRKSLETHEKCYKSLERVKKACTALKKNTEKCFIITWKGEKHGTAWKFWWFDYEFSRESGTLQDLQCRCMIFEGASWSTFSQTKKTRICHL